MVAGARADHHERQPVLGGDAGHQGLGAVAAGVASRIRRKAAVSIIVVLPTIALIAAVPLSQSTHTLAAIFGHGNIQADAIKADSHTIVGVVAYRHIDSDNSCRIGRLLWKLRFVSRSVGPRIRRNRYTFMGFE